MTCSLLHTFEKIFEKIQNKCGNCVEIMIDYFYMKKSCTQKERMKHENFDFG